MTLNGRDTTAATPPRATGVHDVATPAEVAPDIRSDTTPDHDTPQPDAGRPDEQRLDTEDTSQDPGRRSRRERSRQARDVRQRTRGERKEHALAVMIRESMRGSTAALRIAFLCVGVSGIVSFVASFRGLTNLASAEAQWGWMSPGLSLIVDVLTVAGAALIIAMAVDRVGRLFGWALFLLADAASIAGNWYDAAKVRDLRVGGVAVNVAPPIALALCLKGGEMAWRRLRRRRAEADVLLGEQEHRREIEQRRLDLEEYERRTRVDAQTQAELLRARTAARQVAAPSRPDASSASRREAARPAGLRMPDAAIVTGSDVLTSAVPTSERVPPGVMSWIRDVATSDDAVDVTAPEAVIAAAHYAPSRVQTPDAWVGVAVALVVSGGLSVPKATERVGQGPGAGGGLPGREKKVHRDAAAYRRRHGEPTAG